MNKNRKRETKDQNKQLRKAGFPKPEFKGKVKKFPSHNDDALSLVEQRRKFYGANYKSA